MSKVNDFNRKLHSVFSCMSDELDMQDISLLMQALMEREGVQFKEPIHLDHERVAICDLRYRGNVEAMFLDEINTLAHSMSIDLFSDACHAYLNYSRSTLIERRTKLANLGETFQKLKGYLQPRIVYVNKAGKLREGGASQ